MLNPLLPYMVDLPNEWTFELDENESFTISTSVGIPPVPDLGQPFIMGMMVRLTMLSASL